MARYSCGMTATIAGTSLRPIFGLLSTATVTGVLRQVEIWNTTAVEATFKLVRFSGGTAGAAQTERKYRINAPTPSCGCVAGFTADATIDEDLGVRFGLGAAKGSGVALPFGDYGWETSVGATSGIGLIPVGTGQIVEVNFTWDE